MAEERTRAVWRYEVPVDDQWHEVQLGGLGSQPQHVASRRSGIVEFWITQYEGAPTSARYFRVFGTGHQLEPGIQYVGTALDGLLVWHLFEKNRLL